MLCLGAIVQYVAAVTTFHQNAQAISDSLVARIVDSNETHAVALAERDRIFVLPSVESSETPTAVEIIGSASQDRGRSHRCADLRRQVHRTLAACFAIAPSLRCTSSSLSHEV